MNDLHRLLRHPRPLSTLSDAHTPLLLAVALMVAVLFKRAFARVRVARRGAGLGVLLRTGDDLACGDDEEGISVVGVDGYVEGFEGVCETEVEGDLGGTCKCYGCLQKGSRGGFSLKLVGYEAERRIH